MKNTVTLVVIGILLVYPAVAEDERTWISSSGSRIEAALVSAEGAKVVLKTADGRVINVRMGQLAKADREYLAGLTNLSADLAPVQQWSFDAGSVNDGHDEYVVIGNDRRTPGSARHGETPDDVLVGFPVVR